MNHCRRTRPTGLASVLALAVLAAGTALGAEAQMLRFRSATVSTPDLSAFERAYREQLGYELRERGRIERSLARSWGAPRMQGRRYVLLSPQAAPDVSIRAVESPPTPGFRALTSHGWNAIEIVVRDPDAVHRRIDRQAFRVIGEPAFLSGYPSIRAFQVVGPAEEVLYLTAETGDRARSPLPDPGGEIGRIFIMVLAGPDIHALNDWYARQFGLVAGTVRDRPVGVVQRAQGLSADATIPLTTVRLAQHGNLLELDGYPASAGARPQRAGELPPGIALVSVAVRDLDALHLQFLTPPQVRRGALYQRQRTATVRGPAGELLELIEEPSPKTLQRVHSSRP